MRDPLVTLLRIAGPEFPRAHEDGWRGTIKRIAADMDAKNPKAAGLATLGLLNLKTGMIFIQIPRQKAFTEKRIRRCLPQIRRKAPRI